jgi:hypothetical protein
MFSVPDARLRKDRNFSIEVRRDEIGFHVVIPSGLKYSARDLDGRGLLPVASITIREGS